MSDADAGTTRDALASAIRSFTDAEVALGEIVAAAQRLRSASAAVEQAHADVEGTEKAAVEAVEVLRDLALRLERVAVDLSKATIVLERVDGDRLHVGLDLLNERADAADLAVASIASQLAIVEAASRRVVLLAAAATVLAGIAAAAALIGLVM